MITKNSKITQRYYRILIHPAYDQVNVLYPLFPTLKKYDKEFKVKFFLDKANLLTWQSWSEIIKNVIEVSKYFVTLLANKTVEKNRYIQEELLTQWKDFSGINSSGMI